MSLLESRFVFEQTLHSPELEIFSLASMNILWHELHCLADFFSSDNRLTNSCENELGLDNMKWTNRFAWRGPMPGNEEKICSNLRNESILF
jgi:hypothetical protein